MCPATTTPRSVTVSVTSSMITVYYSSVSSPVSGSVTVGEQFFSGLVGSSGNGRAALAPLDDADFQMWYWHLWLNLLLMVQKRPILFSTVGRGIFTCCRGMIACNRSSAASRQWGSWQSQRRGSVASSGWMEQGTFAEIIKLHAMGFRQNAITIFRWCIIWIVNTFSDKFF